MTARIIAELEAGRVPWVQPWAVVEGAGSPAPGLPHNAVTGRAYSGVNILLLWSAVIEKGWPSQGWLTYRQAQAAGGCVRKGEHGVSVVYADRFTPKGDGGGRPHGRDPAGRRGDAGSPDSGGGEGGVNAAGASPRAKSIAFLKRFTVFNVAQCDGLRPGLAQPVPPRSPKDRIAAAEAVIAGSGVEVRIGGNEAYYAPEPDVVAVPPPAAFFDPVDWYRTGLHELTHATGHPKRLNRRLVTDFGSKDYGREELVAELGAAFLCASLGIAPSLRHADYLAAWLGVLREDNRAIIHAASAASKAADWLLAQANGAGPDGGATPDSVDRAAGAGRSADPRAGAAGPVMGRAAA